MPELPEVETTRRGIEPHLVRRSIREVTVRNSRLRQAVSPSLADLREVRISAVSRRAKYLIITLQPPHGHLLIHLGMSGSLRVATAAEPLRPHDHVLITLSSRRQLRFHDPRRFGIFLHLPAGEPLDHPLLRDLGPEPLSDEFSAAHLAKACRGRRAAIKTVVMNARIVVGVGNIYASEALFLAGIRPATAAGRISKPRLSRLVDAIREVLTASIRAGGTTLRDFLGAEGEPGYFRQDLKVYERADRPCLVCATPIRHRVLGQRSTYWCPQCQR